MVGGAPAGAEPAPPLIELRGVRKAYGGHDGEDAVEVLHGLDLDIRAGEFVAIIGASGSGKSTLMHLLGGLDRPSAGRYRFAGEDLAGLDADGLARLRREAFGFVFQGYHLIRALDASHNVQVPAVYAGVPVARREARARALLARLGLADRVGHRPFQLSGGQQQRVSIARALMNGGRVILADEPTGALDSRSGAEVMALLRELADAGHTVVVITHDPKVAAQTRRVVSLGDGRIVSDLPQRPDADAAGAAAPPAAAAAPLPPAPQPGEFESASWWADALEATSSAWQTLWVSRFRTLLTLLGIVIGVVSVIVLMAVGRGNSEEVIKSLSTFGGSHRLSVRPGVDGDRVLWGALSESDVRLLGEVPNVQVATAFSIGWATMRSGVRSSSNYLWALGPGSLELYGWRMARGSFFTPADDRGLATVLVLGPAARRTLFPDAQLDPIGSRVLVNNVPFLVIGVLEDTGDPDADEIVALPFRTGALRVFGYPNPTMIQVRVEDPALIDSTIAEIGRVLEAAHRARDFEVTNNPAYVREATRAADRQTLMLVMIAGIALVVGGIGVMNIMLMSVKERTREIGIRMAAGARERDIRRQFLTEAVLVSGVGGVAGVVLGLLVGVALDQAGVPVLFSVRSMLLAFGSAAFTGLVFGYMPARQAARLDPVVALAGD